MKQLITFSLCLLSILSYGQNPPQKIASNYQFLSVGGDSSLRLPKSKTTTNNYVDTGALYYNKSDKKIHWLYDKTHDTTFVGGGSGGGITPTNLDSLNAMLKNAFQNDTDLVIMGGTVRDTATVPFTNAWAFVSSITPDHYTLGFDSLHVHNLSTGGFTVLYPHMSRPIAYIAVPDESYIQEGWQFGSSVGTDSASTFMTREVYTGGAVWWDHNSPPNYIDLYRSSSIQSVTYDTTTGEFVVELPPVTQFLSSRAAECAAITGISPDNSVYPVIDGNATFNDSNPLNIHLYMYYRTTGAKVTGTFALKPAFQISGPPYWTYDPGSEQSGSGNVWIMAIFKRTH
jgi:hypothetical protein